MNSAGYGLPQSSLVGFQTHRLKFPKFIWRNSPCAAELDLLKYAYATPHEDDPVERFSDELAQFWCDRYGGEGVGYNGGSGRCGDDKLVQIKGIGQTPLLGTATDKLHSYGGATLGEAIREAIWGEIFNALTPHGATRVLGILGTNTFTYSSLRPVNGRNVDGKRALILRQLSVRPAHFMRAVYFDNADPWLSGPGMDAQRTKAAIATFHLALRDQLGWSAETADDDPISLINRGLVEMFGRIARQVAVTQAKRLPHCTLNCSNICLNGKLIDFGTATAVRGYRPYIIDYASRRFLFEEDSFLATIRNLHFYLKKYLPRVASAALMPVDTLIQHYLSAYDSYAVAECAKLTGLPVDNLERCPASVIEDFVSAFAGVLRLQGPTPQAFDWTAHNSDLTLVLPDLAFCSTPGEADDILRLRLDDRNLRQALISSYFQLRQHCLAQTDAAPAAVILYAALNCSRLNFPIESLFRPRLKRRVDLLLASTNASKKYGAFIDQTVASCIAVASDAGADGFRLDFLLGMPWQMTLAGPCILDGTPVARDAFLTMLGGSPLPRSHYNAAALLLAGR